MDGLIGACIGRLGGDAELKYTTNAKPILCFRAVVQDRAAQERGETPQWLRCAVFGPEAVELVGRLHKGDEAYLEGRLSLRRWTGQDGTERSGLDLVVSRCEPLGQIGRRAPARPAHDAAPVHAAHARPAGEALETDDQLPF